MDSLRAIAALAIVAYHVAPHAGAFRAEFTTALSAQFSTGVALFFLISGTLLYRPFVLAHATGERLPDVRAYAWRRFLRIVPAYWAALTVTGIFIDSAGLRPAAAVLRLRADLLARGGLPGHPGRLDALHRGVLLPFLPVFAFALRVLSKRTRASVWRVEAVTIMALFVFGLAWRALALGADSEALQTSVNTLPAWVAWFAVGMGLAVTSAWFTEGGGSPRSCALSSGPPASAGLSRPRPWL